MSPLVIRLKNIYLVIFYEISNNCTPLIDDILTAQKSFSNRTRLAETHGVFLRVAFAFDLSLFIVLGDEYLMSFLHAKMY